MWCQAGGGDEAVEDGGHDEVCHAAAGVTPAAGQGIGETDGVLVEEAGRPDLAGDEGAAEDADEEADGVEAVGAVDAAGAEGGDCAGDQAAREGVAGSEAVAAGACDETDQEGGAEAYDVAVEDLVGGEVDVFLDDVGEERWECVPACVNG